MMLAEHGKKSDITCSFGCCHSDELHASMAGGGRTASKSKRLAHRIQRSREHREVRKIAKDEQ